ncbi:hypothetical protein BDZ91DRAFT_794494 [Kalaharituber pfeilii]|nr:hypothetical protein BDZ91DRAFT_794494 [Kalaharituber pfeilii]
MASTSANFTNNVGCTSPVTDGPQPVVTSPVHNSRNSQSFQGEDMGATLILPSKTLDTEDVRQSVHAINTILASLSAVGKLTEELSLATGELAKNMQLYGNILEIRANRPCNDTEETINHEQTKDETYIQNLCLVEASNFWSAFSQSGSQFGKIIQTEHRDLLLEIQNFILRQSGTSHVQSSPIWGAEMKCVEHNFISRSILGPLKHGYECIKELTEEMRISRVVQKCSELGLLLSSNVDSTEPSVAALMSTQSLPSTTPQTVDASGSHSPFGCTLSDFPFSHTQTPTGQTAASNSNTSYSIESEDDTIDTAMIENLFSNARERPSMAYSQIINGQTVIDISPDGSICGSPRTTTLETSRSPFTIQESAPVEERPHSSDLTTSCQLSPDSLASELVGVCPRRGSANSIPASGTKVFGHRRSRNFHTIPHMSGSGTVSLHKPSFRRPRIPVVKEEEEEEEEEEGEEEGNFYQERRHPREKAYKILGVQGQPRDAVEGEYVAKSVPGSHTKHHVNRCYRFPDGAGRSRFVDVHCEPEGIISEATLSIVPQSGKATNQNQCPQKKQKPPCLEYST